MVLATLNLVHSWSYSFATTRMNRVCLPSVISVVINFEPGSSIKLSILLKSSLGPCGQNLILIESKNSIILVLWEIVRSVCTIALNITYFMSSSNGDNLNIFKTLKQMSPTNTVYYKSTTPKISLLSNKTRSRARTGRENSCRYSLPTCGHDLLPIQ